MIELLLSILSVNSLDNCPSSIHTLFFRVLLFEQLIMFKLMNKPINIHSCYSYCIFIKNHPSFRSLPFFRIIPTETFLARRLLILNIRKFPFFQTKVILLINWIISGLRMVIVVSLNDAKLTWHFLLQ